jgi:hypothetical protein
MLRIEEIVGAMDDEFRYALDVLDDDRLAALAADKAALRRMRPVGVSHAEALAMIADIQARREAKRLKDAEDQRRKAERAAKRKAAPRRRKQPLAPPAIPVEATSTRALPTPALPAPATPARLAPPQAAGPAIRLPPPAETMTAIILPPPVPVTAPPAPPPFTRRKLTVAVVITLLVALALLAI